MARGLEIGRRVVATPVLIIVMFLGSNAFALSEIERCARKADRLIAKAYPDAKISREEFVNTTPGSYYQEYTGTYLVDGQKVTAEFYSPFICDNLSLTSTAQ